MKNQEVEILKIGTILPSTIENKNTIMVVYNSGPIFDHYVNILREKCDEYKYLKTEKSIVGTPQIFRSSLLGHKPVDTLKGISDGDPIVGIPYTINNGSWHTSKIEKIIDDYILITKNSVYAIHSVSEFRNNKLKDLGI